MLHTVPVCADALIVDIFPYPIGGSDAAPFKPGQTVPTFPKTSPTSLSTAVGHKHRAEEFARWDLRGLVGPRATRRRFGEMVCGSFNTNLNADCVELRENSWKLLKIDTLRVP